MTHAPTPTLRILLLPGWQNSGPGHWQSQWEASFGHRRVEQSDWDRPLRGDWMARLDEVLLESEQPAILIAHSLGCQLVAAWAAHSTQTERVRGAMLVAPPDTERDDMPPELHSWRPIARKSLPFTSVTVISSDDPYCEPARAMRMAADWGSDPLPIGPCGHINEASELGLWPEGYSLLFQLKAKLF